MYDLAISVIIYMNPTTQAPLAPLPLRVITLLGLIGSILGLLVSLAGFGLLLAVLKGGNVTVAFIFLIPLALSLFNTVSFIGLRKMKKWAFYVFMVGTLISIAAYLLVHSSSHLVTMVFSILFSLYLLSLRKRFV